MKQVSIIIINYNTFQLTCHCIDSIIEHCLAIDYEIIVVDNASTSCDPYQFSVLYPMIKLIVSKKNTGFAGGNNLGLQQAVGQYLLLLNSDTELLNNAPKICLDYLQQHAEVGMVTCQLQYPNGVLQYNCRRFRTISWELLQIIPLYKLWTKSKASTTMLHHYFDHLSVVEADWVWGTFMMFSRDILDLFPDKKLHEDYFMYCEDVLWSWYIKSLGYKIVFLPEAKIMHIHKGSQDKTKAYRVRKQSIANHAHFMKRYYTNWTWYLFAAIYYSKQYIALWSTKWLSRTL